VAAPTEVTVDATPVDAAITHVTVSGQVAGYPNFARMEGIQVTVVDHPEVVPAYTNAVGEFDLPGVPAFSDVTIRFEKETYVPCTSRVLHLQDEDYLMEGSRQSLTLVPSDLAVALASYIGLELNPGRAFVIATVLGVDRSYLTDATSRMTPMTGEPAIYLNDSWIPDPSLEATSMTGTVVFINYEPGLSEVAFAHKTLENCVGVGADAPRTLPIRVFPGAMTHAGYVECRP
jgi:hypothetical protein